MNDHEQEQAEEGHIIQAPKVELGKPRISKKLREKLKKKGETINVRAIAENTIKTEEPEVMKLNDSLLK